jgi:hypothetical protein
MSSVFSTKTDECRSKFREAGNLVSLWEKAEEELCNVFLGEKLPMDVTDATGDRVIIHANRKITRTDLRKLLDEKALDIDTSLQRIALMGIMGPYWERLSELKSEKPRR